MPNFTLVEGRLSFEFKDVKSAEQYDSWQHYRGTYNSACGSSKAVDFIVCKRDEVWLIEVKDYRRNRRVKSIGLADEVALKVRDTMAGLVSTRFIGTNTDEVAHAKAALSQKKLRVALHLEQPANPSRLFPLVDNPANIAIKLKQQLRFADPHAKLISRRDFPANLGTVNSI